MKNVIKYPNRTYSISSHFRHIIFYSFNQSAVFLIGGQTKDIMPKAIFIRSGDIVVMSEQSRLAYHGVPKILPPSNYGTPIPNCLSEAELVQRIQQIYTIEPFCSMEAQKFTENNQPKNIKSVFDFRDILKFDYHRLQANWRYFEQYLASTRININIRQVYH